MGFGRSLKNFAKRAVSSPGAFLETATYGGPGITSIVERNKNTKGSAVAAQAGIQAGGNYTPEDVKPGLTSGGYGPSGQLSGPGMGEKWGAENIHRTAGPSKSEMFADQAGKQLGQHSQSENIFQQFGKGMTGPGAAEGQYGRTQQALSGPTATQQFNQANRQALGSAGQGEQFFAANQGKFNMPTNTQGAFDKLQAGPAGLDAYYDRARDRQAGGINDQLAARGQYGSSAGLDQLSEGAAALNAEQANREADFRLKQQDQIMQGAQSADMQNQGLLGLGLQGAQGAQSSELARLGLGGQLAGQQQGELLGVQGLLGQQAGQADAMGVDRFGALMGGAGASDSARTDRFGTAGGLIAAGDSASLDRVGMGADIARGVQGLQENRLGDMFNRGLALGDRASGAYASSAGAAIDADAANADAAMALEMGIPAEQVLQDRHDAAAARARQQSYLDAGFQGWSLVNESARDSGNFVTGGGGKMMGMG